MIHLFQVGVGSGGMPVLDMLSQEPRITRVTLVDPDVYKPHNVVRHVFPLSAVGQPKTTLAEAWLKERRPDLEVRLLPVDLLDPAYQTELEQAVAEAHLGICAADKETAKFHFDALMRKQGKPWTLGEVLSGGMGGFIHWFVPEGPCYGCVATHLQRSVSVDNSPPPDYSQPGGPVPEATIPASKASIQSIAALHALLTGQLLDHCLKVPPTEWFEPLAARLGFTTLLMSLQQVPDVFDDAFRPYRFRIPRRAECLICQTRPTPSTPEDLDVALDQALARLGDA